MNPVQRLQSVIGYEFSDPSLLSAALRHRSIGMTHNERLEFLGDSILGLVISQEIFARFPNASEGALTRIRAQLVRQATLAIVARRLSLGEFLKLGPSAGKSGGSDRASILADALEAVLAAVFLDSDFKSARRVILGIFQNEIDTIRPDKVRKDSKTTLQEYLQAKGDPLPTYEVIETRGQPHNREFVVDCSLIGCEIQEMGLGSSRKIAEQNAAFLVLEKLGVAETLDE